MTTPVRIKTFRADSLQQAFEQIRREFGPDASVLETKAVKRGIFGKNLFDVTASTSLVEMRSMTTESVLKTDVGAEVELDKSTDESPAPDRSETVRPQVFNETDVKPAMSPSNGLFEQSRRSNSTTSSKIDRICNQVGQEMLNAGMESCIVEQWMMAARTACDPSVFRDAWSLRSEILTWVRDFVHCAPPLDLQSRDALRIALVGPTGAGKTTTIAKLAATLSMDSQENVGILQLDPSNLGPCRSVAGYAELMGWDFQVVTHVDEISRALELLSGCQRILVDTPGCSPSDKSSLEWLEQSLNRVRPTSTLLVIPSTCNAHTFQRYETSFGGFSPDSLILTKLDESGGIGPLFSCLQNCSIPVSFLTNGHHVPSDLIPATNARLAQHVFSFTS